MRIQNNSLRVVAFAAAAVLSGSGAAATAPSAVVRGAQQLPLELLLQRVQQVHRDMADMQATFRQRFIQRPGAPPRITEGIWRVQTPGRMRIEYTETQRLFVADGKAMYWYLPGDKQVQVLPSTSLDPKQVPTLYLSGEGDLGKDFEFSGTQWQEPLAAGNIQIRLLPRAAGAGFTHLVLEVDPATAIVARLVWFGMLGEANDYQFFNVETDVGLADELFRFTIPPGTQVEYLGG